MALDIQKVKKLKEMLNNEIDNRSAELRELSQSIYNNPELAFNEIQASEWLTEKLEQAGFQVERGIAGLSTAFRATWESSAGGPVIALLAEYDALKDLGHACGHNLICSASIGAALALRQVLEGGELPGIIQVIGTPAEEGGGGKIIMLKQGVFEGIDAAMQFHPGSRTMVTRGALAAVKIKMSFYGKAAHPAAAPQDGINALDACIQTFNAINALRQHLKDEIRIHGIITNGGSVPNIVPEFAEAVFMLRAKSMDYLEVMKEKVKNAALGAALSVGARVEFSEGLTLAERKNNRVMAELFSANLHYLGIEVNDPPKVGGVGSSDIGNVSQVLPVIQPYLAIAPAGTASHTPEFRSYAGGETGIAGMLSAAKSLAMTVLDLLSDPQVIANVKRDFIAYQEG